MSRERLFDGQFEEAVFGHRTPLVDGVTEQRVQQMFDGSYPDVQGFRMNGKQEGVNGVVSQTTSEVDFRWGEPADVRGAMQGFRPEVSLRPRRTSRVPRPQP